jgi:hypothetical protein
MEVAKTDCPEITNKNIKEVDVFLGFSELLKNGSAWFVSEEGWIIIQSTLPPTHNT